MEAASGGKGAVSNGLIAKNIAALIDPDAPTPKEVCS